MRSRLLVVPGLLAAACTASPSSSPGDPAGLDAAAPTPLFAGRATHALPVGAGTLVAADLDGDGDLDLATVASSDADGIGVLLVLRNDAGTFTSIAELPAQAQATWLAAGDRDGDGDVDLVSAAFDGQGRLGMLAFANAGDGRFTRTPMPDPAAYAGPLAAGDLDGDGRADLVALLADEDSAPLGIELLLGAGPARRVLDVRAPTSWHQPLALADLDRDGALDLVTGAGVQRGDGHAGFAAPVGLGLDGAPASLGAGHLDRDGALDLAATTRDGRVLVASGDGRGGLGGFTARAIADAAGPLALGDVDGDGVDDLVIGGAQASTVALATGAILSDLPAARAVLAADLDGDARADVVVASRRAPELVVLRTGPDRRRAR